MDKKATFDENLSRILDKRHHRKNHRHVSYWLLYSENAERK